MGKLTIFTIILTRDIVTAGGIVDGRVVVQLCKPMKMRGIHLRFFGFAKVRWTEQHGSGDNRRTVVYSSYESYYDQNLILFGKPPGQMSGDNPTLPAGHYEYPFALQLPPTLPPSAEFQFGCIRHQLKATIDKPWKIDHNVTRPFTVIAHLDLNYQGAMMPIRGSKKKELGCFCCVAGEINIDCQLDRVGYVPGEYVVPKGAFENNSSRVIDTHCVKLIQMVMFITPRKSRMNHCTLTEVVGREIQPHSRAELNGFAVLIPPCPASGLGGCNIMNLQYFIQPEMDPSGPSFDLELPMAITVGTIPIQQVQHGFCQAPFNPDWHNAAYPQVQPPPPPVNSDAYSASAPPPSYASVVGGQPFVDDDDDKKSIDHGGNLSSWAPAYTYYSWGNPNQAHGM